MPQKLHNPKDPASLLSALMTSRAVGCRIEADPCLSSRSILWKRHQDQAEGHGAGSLMIATDVGFCSEIIVRWRTISDRSGNRKSLDFLSDSSLHNGPWILIRQFLLPRYGVNRLPGT